MTQRELVRNALRMRPDRIIVGEVRGGEALDMLQAMNTGHEGSMTTIHANTPRDALIRLENMVSMAASSLPSKAMRQQISSAIGVVLQVARLTDGKRKVLSIQEITGMEGDIITMQEIFQFKQTGVDERGRRDRPLLRHRRAAALHRPAAHLRRDDFRIAVRSNPPVSLSRHGHSLLYLRHTDFHRRRPADRGRLPELEFFQGPRGRAHRAPAARDVGWSPCRRAEQFDHQETHAQQNSRMQRLLLEMPRISSLDRMLVQSGMSWSVAEFLGITLMAAVVAFSAASYFALPLLMRIALAAAAAALPYQLIKRASAKRCTVLKSSCLTRST